MGLLWVAREAGGGEGAYSGRGRAWVAGKCPVARVWIQLGGYQVVMVGIVLCWISLLQVRRANGFGGHGGWWIIGRWWICARGGSQWVRA